jgi:hypothetical protein
MDEVGKILIFFSLMLIKRIKEDLFQTKGGERDDMVEKGSRNFGI